MYFTRKVSIEYLDTHLQGAPGGTVAVYSVTRMFDSHPPTTSVCFYFKPKELRNKMKLVPSPLPRLSERLFKTCGRKWAMQTWLAVWTREFIFPFILWSSFPTIKIIGSTEVLNIFHLRDVELSWLIILVIKSVVRVGLRVDYEQPCAVWPTKCWSLPLLPPHPVGGSRWVNGLGANKLWEFISAILFTTPQGDGR